MFIVNGKSHCCNDFYWHLVYIAASKEYLRRMQIILCYVLDIFRFGIPSTILSEISIQIGWYF